MVECVGAVVGTVIGGQGERGGGGGLVVVGEQGVEEVAVQLLREGVGDGAAAVAVVDGDEEAGEVFELGDEVGVFHCGAVAWVGVVGVADGEVEAGEVAEVGGGGWGGGEVGGAGGGRERGGARG